MWSFSAISQGYTRVFRDAWGFTGLYRGMPGGGERDIRGFQDLGCKSSGFRFGEPLYWLSAFGV